MKTKISENSLFDASGRGEIRGGGYRRAAPNKSKQNSKQQANIT